jgi:hypothetical protein
VESFAAASGQLRSDLQHECVQRSDEATAADRLTRPWCGREVEAAHAAQSQPREDYQQALADARY